MFKFAHDNITNYLFSYEKELFYDFCGHCHDGICCCYDGIVW